MRKCSFKGCNNKHKARGLCKNHYQQQRLGKPLTKIKKRNKPGTYTQCTWKDCKRPHRGKGLCHTHYEQKYRYKIPLIEINSTQRKKNMSFEETVLWCLNNTTWNDDCIEWNKSCNSNGYASVSFKGKIHTLGRLILEYFNGKPLGRIMMHSCDNPKCINPAHLKWGTQKENIQDMVKKGRRRNQFSPKPTLLH